MKKWLLICGGVAVVAIGATAAAIPWLNQPPPEPIVVERPRIEAAMGEYRTAYRNRNLDGVLDIFPELPAESRRTMERAFTNCLVYEVTFDVMNVTLSATDPNSAEVDLRSTHECTPNSGGQQTSASRHEVFSLRKIKDEWLIASAAAVSAGRPQ
jgi:ketosteroid isomerase-like protein